MPHIEESSLDQTALLWTAGTKDDSGYGFDDYGQPRRSVAFTEIPCRWVTQDGWATDPQGNRIATNATVIVKQEIDIGSLMWEGSQEDLEATLPGTGTGNLLLPTEDVMEVVSISITPDIKNRVNQYTLGLRRYTDTMAETV